jgi:hypothetical protein
LVVSHKALLFAAQMIRTNPAFIAAKHNLRPCLQRNGDNLLIAHCSALCYIYSMTMTQTVDIPADHRLVIDVPREIPAGPTVIAFTPAKKSAVGKTNRTLEDALRRAAEKAADSNRRPLSHFLGILSPNTYGDGVAYQRAIRDEWDG